MLNSAVAVWLIGATVTPQAAMWLSGGVNREAWFSFKVEAGQLLEGALRDDQGKSQGTLLVEVIKPLTTDAQGHWFSGSYVVASDSHMRWWMDSGEGKALRKKCAYHLCEENAMDCTATKKGASIHLEKFRLITQDEIEKTIPSWAFTRTCVGALNKFLKGKNLGRRPPEEKTGQLPWKEPGDEEEEEEEEPDTSSGERNLRDEIRKARDGLAQLEKRLESRKEKGKGRKESHTGKPKAVEKAGKEKAKSSKKKAKKKAKEAEEAAEAEVVSRKGKRKSEAASSSKPKKKREESSSDEEYESSEEDDEGEGLFGEAVTPIEGEKKKKKRKRDRGPFGGGEVVRYKGPEDTDSEADFQDALVGQKASNQLRLVQYAKKLPGRLASRLLLKMEQESARGLMRAEDDEAKALTPPAAVHYLLTVMLPTLQQRVNLRGQRELKTLCTALDYLGRHQPARAADLLAQRVKALEKASHDGHWTSAQFLELLPPEGAGLLERDEEVFMNREALLELKLRGMSKEKPKGDQKGNPPAKGGKKGKEAGKGKGSAKEKEKET